MPHPLEAQAAHDNPCCYGDYAGTVRGHSDHERLARLQMQYNGLRSQALFGIRNAFPPLENPKLAAAKAYLGSRWILHPQYKRDPRHSCDHETWYWSIGHRAHELEISRRAALDRANNPASTHQPE